MPSAVADSAPAHVALTALAIIRALMRVSLCQHCGGGNGCGVGVHLVGVE